MLPPELPIEKEIRREKARTLGRAGERLEAACAAAWTLHDARLRGELVGPVEYGAARARAVDLRHLLLIQREALGLRSQADVDRCYPLPPEDLDSPAP